ncbi:hypothetical protein ROSEINA2194_00204 [Roseburia inulinivorans DSM 16841]|uniref:HTH merR-type domain-containing protein n=1 Tax=Roseburia inulinivorans DSM 16841 TaxID=622312 RepID=C0FNB0_9FIRM|nr:hypothetical protein ROSEINA2194_00204 [Roseburia inulinivorans DSM 16841]
MRLLAFRKRLIMEPVKRSSAMAVRYTEEQLNTVDKSLLIQMFLNQRELLETLTTEVRSLNERMQLMME